VLIQNIFAAELPRKINKTLLRETVITDQQENSTETLLQLKQQ